jgi:hypothetical protein
MIKTCSQCHANRLENDKPHGFCSLGYKQKTTTTGKTPVDDCPAPRSHAELIAVMEIDKDET